MRDRDMKRKSRNNTKEHNEVQNNYDRDVAALQQ